MLYRKHLVLWLTIIAAGCSTLTPGSVYSPDSTLAGVEAGIEALAGSGPGTDDTPNLPADLPSGSYPSRGTEQPPNTRPEPTGHLESSNPGDSKNATNQRVGADKNYVIPPALLPYDGIPPVYEPQFVTAAESPLVNDELVMGVSVKGQAKAYPVTVLRFREMVNDELAGLPILVTW